MKSYSEKIKNLDYSQIIYYLIILLLLRIDLVFLNNTPTGGDMGAHVVPIKYFVDNFASNLQINGWSNDWFAGYPLYYFYFPFPAIITYFFHFLFPFGIAFKIMVVGSIILNIYSIEKLLRRENHLFSHIGIVCGLAFVLTESFTIYGGNLASTLAGQFSFTYSLAFGNLAIYFLSKSNHQYRFILSSIFLAFCLLSHLIPFLIYLPVYAFYWLLKKENFILKLISIFIFSSLVTRWIVPLIYNLEFTTNMSYTPYTKVKDLIKPDVLPVVLILILFLLVNFGYKKIIENKIFSFFEIYLLFISTFLYFYVPEGALWNGRLVPFFNLGVIILGFKILDLIFNEIVEYQQGELLTKLTIFVSVSICLYIFYDKWSQYSSYNLFTFGVIGFSIFQLLKLLNSTFKLINLGVFVFIISTASFLPHWVNWNFTGYEGKNNWEEIESLYASLNKLPPGRIMWEPNSDLNKYGTPMVLMTIPYFTQHTSMEGLYFDSSITTPFHFIAVSGLAESPSNPVGGLSYINNEFEKGVDYLNDLGVDYFITYTESITEKANSNSDLIYLFTSEPFSVFKIESDKVELVNEKIEIFEKISFVERTTSSIFRNTEYKNFFDQAYKNYGYLNNYRVIELPPNIEVNSSIKSNLEIRDLTISSDKISFTTNRPNELHIIKFSYFPNWEIKDGAGPYRISPSFMSVIPYSNNVVLSFERVNLETYSFYFALISLLLSLILFRKIRND